MDLVAFKVYIEVENEYTDGVEKDNFIALVESDLDDAALYSSVCRVAKNYVGDGILSLSMDQLNLCEDGALTQEQWAHIGEKMGWLGKSSCKLPTSVYDKDGNEVFSKDWD